ncbi:MAG: GlsB/YeaQ/YmgE family stress response membrane protein [Lautropia sp.]|nr:GlsB/YeaQ/YmgE family stress response membrane protein [Lautropia sp.]
MIALIQMLVVGLIVGLLARAIMPGTQSHGWIATALVGIGGSVVANFLGGAMGVYQSGETAGWIASVLGAIVVLFVYGKVTGKNG